VVVLTEKRGGEGKEREAGRSIEKRREGKAHSLLSRPAQKRRNQRQILRERGKRKRGEAIFPTPREEGGEKKRAVQCPILICQKERFEKEKEGRKERPLPSFERRGHLPIRGKGR